MATPRGLTFQVDNVNPAIYDKTRGVVSMDDVKKCLLERGETPEYVHLDDVGNEAWLVSRQHGFFHACMTAFAGHHGLVLSADVILQMILEGLAAHVAKYPEELRAKFVMHDGKEKIHLQRDDFVLGSASNDWAGLVDEFGAEIRRLTNPSVYEDLVGESFSTSTATDIVCRQIALMSTVKHYFEYSFCTMCGFPTITLLGTRDDYVLLEAKVQRMGKYMMPSLAEKWIPALESVISHFVSAWDGDIDKQFWGSFCKYDSTHGSGAATYVSGWINILFPYLGVGEDSTDNQYCLPWPELKEKVLQEKKAMARNPFREPGNQEDVFVRRFCFADVEWEYLDSKIPLLFKAGFVGGTIDPQSSAITPRMTWGIVHSGKTSK